MATPSKRTRLSNKAKLDIVIASKKPGFKSEDIAKQYGLGLLTVHKILKEEGKNGQCSSPRDKSRDKSDQTKTNRALPDSQIELEKRLFQWILSTEKSGLLVDGNFIKARVQA